MTDVISLIRVKNMIISSECGFETVFIRINGILHLLFSQNKFLALQSWYMTPHKKWVIEITLNGGVITADYAKKHRWINVLSCLESALYDCKNKTIEFDDTE